MRFLASIFLAAMSLAACQPAVKDAEESQTWQPSILSGQTLEKVQAALKVYQQCINDETRKHLNDKEDSRQVADTILKNCESKLSEVRVPFDAEKVPGSISERYLRSKRSLAAQQVLRVVMATQAVRSAGGLP